MKHLFPNEIGIKTTRGETLTACFVLSEKEKDLTLQLFNTAGEMLAEAKTFKDLTKRIDIDYVYPLF